MVHGQMSLVLRHLQKMARCDLSHASDGQLLERFVRHHDESAFEILLERLGPMVLGVCRRVLPQVQDAEDAFQATFLVLARRAAAVQPCDMVGNWLYGVAYRTALKARAAALRRAIKEKQMPPRPVPEPCAELWHEVRAILDQELARLPDKYRLPVVCCDLEGKARREAAAQLCLPAGTLSSRLATGRKMLAQRLTRRGVTLSGGGLATLISYHQAAAVPPTLLSATLRAATATGAVTAGAISTNVAALTQGVLQAMFLTKLKNVLGVLVVFGLLAGGMGLLLNHPAAAQPPVPGVNAPLDPQTEQPLVEGANAAQKKPKKNAEKQPDPFVGLKDKLKKHEEEIAKIRTAMLKEVEAEEKKLAEAAKKAKEDLKGKKDATGVFARLRLEELQLHRLRNDIEIRIRISSSEPARKQTARLQPIDVQAGLQHTNSPSDALRSQLGLEKNVGLVITRVVLDSAAAKAGLKVNDVLVQVQGKKVSSNGRDFHKQLAELSGTTVELTVIRQGKREMLSGVALPAIGRDAPKATTPNKPSTPPKQDDKKTDKQD